MRTPPLLADFTHAMPCKPFCEKSLTLPNYTIGLEFFGGTLSTGPNNYIIRVRRTAPGFFAVNYFLAIAVLVV